MKGLVILALILMASPVAAADMVPVFKQGVGSHMATIYPEGEEDAMPVEFRVDLRCRIVDQAGHVHCIAIGEDPAGYGCGQRAEAVFSRYSVLDMRRTRGARVGKVFPLHLRLKTSFYPEEAEEK